ncbi:MAG TPA: hypothetical protein VMF58_08910, partial [Rhizomicrobium sp.]|nr:hypothetical protein [Rhizomicrobium sp.]
MRTNQIRTAFLGLLLAAAAPATCADAGPASWLTIDPPGSGQTMPLAITGNSLIAGWYADNVTHTKHGFVRNRDGTFTSFDAPDATADTVAYGVNTEGVVTGNYTTLIGGLQYAEGYLRAPNGAIIEFQVPGQRYVTPQAINRRGEIVGMAQSDSGPSISFLRTPTGT